MNRRHTYEPTDKNTSDMPAPATIDEVLVELDRIVDITVEENSPLGIFAFVYRRTTAKIAEGIRDGRFDDGPRMERFDVAFACMYIDAYWQFRENKPLSTAWERAFVAASVPSDISNPIIMQHLLLGMNAHINLDLGIAAAEVAPGGKIESLEKDFTTVNMLLAELLDEIQERISRVSPLMFLLDWIGKRDDEAVVNFSITKARAFAWRFACRLAASSEEERARVIDRADTHVTGIAKLVAHPPGFMLPKVLSVVRYFEEKDIREIIERLKE